MGYIIPRISEHFKATDECKPDDCYLVRKMLLLEHMMYLHKHSINTVQGLSVCNHIICCVTWSIKNVFNSRIS